MARLDQGEPMEPQKRPEVAYVVDLTTGDELDPMATDAVFEALTATRRTAVNQRTSGHLHDTIMEMMAGSSPLWAVISEQPVVASPAVPIEVVPIVSPSVTYTSPQWIYNLTDSNPVNRLEIFDSIRRAAGLNQSIGLNIPAGDFASITDEVVEITAVAMESGVDVFISNTGLFKERPPSAPG